MDFEDDYVHSTCRGAYQDFNGMDRDYGPGSYGGLAFKDIYLKILLLSASKGEQHLIFFFLNSYRAGS
uniref:Isoform 3 of DBIRD complex subunit ZNF326 n=1 Tax=Mus musculus TaxID=10090 RepID=O88291-3|nr:unnamed protein product [Mus musculus]